MIRKLLSRISGLIRNAFHKSAIFRPSETFGRVKAELYRREAEKFESRYGGVIKTLANE